MAEVDPESIPAQEAPAPMSLQLGDGAKLRLMDDVTAWACKLNPKGAVIDEKTLKEIVTDPPHVRESAPCPKVEEKSAPDVLNADEIEAITRFRDTLPLESAIEGVYKVDNPRLLERYLLNKRNAHLDEVYMFHGAPLHVLATIVNEGFNTEASRSGPYVFVSCKSSFSLTYSKAGLDKLNPSVVAQISVMERYLELLKQHREIKEEKAPAFPLLSQPPADTHAILICKILVPRRSRKECLESEIYSVSVASRVYPHLLVHVGPNKVAYAKQKPAASICCCRLCRRVVYVIPAVLFALITGFFAFYPHKG